MVELPSDLSSIFSLATSQGYLSWIGLGISIILYAIIAGIVLIIILTVFSRKFGEAVKYQNALLVSLIISVINLVGAGYITSLLPLGFLGFVIISLVVWIILIKAFFSNLSFIHSIIIGIVGFAVTYFAVPALVTAVGSMLPL